MPEPDTSNAAQQRQEKATAPDRKKADREAEAVSADLKPSGRGAVHGGDETKPGQMQGDEDIGPNADQRDIEKAAAKR